MLSILVTGSRGQLGQELQSHASLLKAHFYFMDHAHLDISNEKEIEHCINKNGINAIINCAAFTGVDQAQTQQENANTINHIAVGSLAKIAKAYGITLIHISTDYVFDGERSYPYTEEDRPNPLSVYGHTKYLGEQAILDLAPSNTIIVRTSWLYSSYGTNFVTTMRRLFQTQDLVRVVADQIGTPTYASDLAQTLLMLLPKIHTTKPKIYHYSNEGVASWYDFAHAIHASLNASCQLIPIPTSQYPTPAKRPLYTLLDKSNIKKDFGIIIPHWHDSLKRALALFHTG